MPELRVDDPVPGADVFARMAPYVVIACDGERAIGYAFWQRYGANVHVVQLVVDPAARGCGAGRALLEEIRARALAAGCTRWFLYVMRDNLPALRLYGRTGFERALEAWALRIGWPQIDGLAGDGDAVAYTPDPSEEIAIAKRFSLVPELLAAIRARPHITFVALREAAALAGFAALDPTFPRVRPFRVIRTGLARALFEALRPHVDLARPLHVIVEEDRPLVDALLAAGAAVSHELYQLAAPLTVS